MRQHLGFLKTSSLVVKIAAWIFLFMGVAGGSYIIAGAIPGKSVLEGIVNMAVSIFFFFFFYIIAKIADLLIKIINEIKKE